MRGSRRFSQAISEGDGISLLADVAAADAARTAEAAGAEGVVVRGAVVGLREATGLPILWCVPGSVEHARIDGADAYLLVAGAYEDDDGRLEQVYEQAVESGLDCVVAVSDENELQLVLDRVDPEVLLLPGRGDDEESPLAVVLGLLADVPVGKLVVAELERLEPEDLAELERAGTDAVIVSAGDVSRLLGSEPVEV
ncbi:MAG: hypothetical protein ACRDNX_08405 [Gaiellaceae bacterium]